MIIKRRYSRKSNKNDLLSGFKSKKKHYNIKKRNPNIRYVKKYSDASPAI